jgi:hypothetical protein
MHRPGACQEAAYFAQGKAKYLELLDVLKTLEGPAPIVLVVVLGVPIL